MIKKFKKILGIDATKSEALRYSLTYLIAGILFVIFSQMAKVKLIEDTMGYFACALIAVCYYTFPYIKLDNKLRFTIRLSGYAFLLIITWAWTIGCFSMCSTEIENTSTNFTENLIYLSLLILFLLVEVILVVWILNLTLKPIFSIFSSIVVTIKTRAKNANTEESKTITYLKSVCATIAYFTPFVTAIILSIPKIVSFIMSLALEISFIIKQDGA